MISMDIELSNVVVRSEVQYTYLWYADFKHSHLQSITMSDHSTAEFDILKSV